ncbi:MAG TPA: EamA family transporter [Treponema sp.]|nr:EamA family transporter [Treponema sp.]
MNRKTVSLFAGAGLLLAACIWGFAFVVVKDSLDYVGPVYMIAFRFSIATVALALLFAPKLRLLNKSYWKNGAVLGGYLFLAYAFQTIGCNYTTAGKNAFLTTIYVMLVPLLGWPLYKKRPGLYVFAAAVISITGIGLLALSNTDGSLLTMNKGDALTLVCGLFYALHILRMERCNATQSTILLTVLQFFFAAVFSWIAAPFFDGAFPVEAVTNPRVIVSMLYLGLLSTMVAFVLQNVGLKYVQSSIAALFLSFESVFGVLFSTLLLHERLTLRMMTGCILIFFAVILAETKFDFLHKRGTKK